ncbi:glycine-rich domain-containing protein [Candidatus Nitrotoga arctica]|uniref:Calcineurin-like phosphoesterase n=1 Tax=Candidatus Nitrotoga arctica TaxID=453162 RepID=A0ABN8ANY8_9PROT|nr:hypothetical protein [Candidatus Nitrotoga arctica]CAG9932403.1 conserved protein of unknown function [Candidatus Nitrotoga arctica]
MIKLHLESLDNLDLEPIIVKAIDAIDGYGWSFDKAIEVAEEYRRFLALCLLFPDDSMVPSNVVDDFWHLHILDTQKYAVDCENFFGYFLHHFPYFGMRGNHDEKNLEIAWYATLDAYKMTFGSTPSAELWPRSNRCPNCGKRANSMSVDIRPTLRDIGLAIV